MDFNTITIQDCLDMYEEKGFPVVIEDGKVTCFLGFDERSDK